MVEKWEEEKLEKGKTQVERNMKTMERKESWPVLSFLRWRR